MKILYLSISYVPSRRASSVQVMKMCSALAKLGHDVTLVGKKAASKHESGVPDDFAFYGVPRSFRLLKVARPKPRGGGALFAALVAMELAHQRRSQDLVFCRDLVGALFAAQLGMPVLFEAHHLPAVGLQQTLFRKLVASRHLVALVAISEALRRDLLAADLAPSSGVLVAHDAADAPSMSSAHRKALGSPPRIGYVGSLYQGRGVELIATLAAKMRDCQFDLFGGNETDLAHWKSQALTPNVVFHGFRAPSELGQAYAELDVLLMPYPKSGIVGASGGQDTSRWASPLKMFEYMASGVPLVSSDLPVLQEVLRDGENALIAPAGDVTAWEKAVRRLLESDELRASLASSALHDVASKYTWDARAKLILQAVKPSRPATAEITQGALSV